MLSRTLHLQTSYTKYWSIGPLVETFGLFQQTTFISLISKCDLAFAIEEVDSQYTGGHVDSGQ